MLKKFSYKETTIVVGIKVLHIENGIKMTINNQTNLKKNLRKRIKELEKKNSK